MGQYDGAGERPLRTLRHARMPEPGKRTLKRQLVAEVEHALKRQPQLRLVKVADGARDNWEFLAKELPPGEEVVDFYHAAEHLRRAFGQVYGEASPKAQASFEEYRHLLLKAEDGVGKVIRTLAYHHGRKRRCKALKQELEYFRRNRARMDYARLRAQNLPIGSGVVEAACKTLVTQRMKRPPTALEHRRRSGHPHLPRAGSERALRWRVEAALRRIPPRDLLPGKRRADSNSPGISVRVTPT